MVLDLAGLAGRGEPGGAGPEGRGRRGATTVRPYQLLRARGRGLRAKGQHTRSGALRPGSTAFFCSPDLQCPATGLACPAVPALPLPPPPRPLLNARDASELVIGVLRR